MKHILLVLIAAIVCMPLAFAEEKPEPLKANWWDGDDFAWVRGANYVPSYAVNSIAIWDEYDGETIDRELMYAEWLRLNSVRVWLHYYPYEKDRDQFLKNYEDFLQRCAKHHIRPMLVVFDGCFGETEPEQHPTPTSVWIPNPGPRRMLPEYRDKMKAYVDDVVGQYVGDPRILFWDVMNEPSSMGVPKIAKGNVEFAYDFARDMADYINEIDPTHPTTIGVGHHSHIPGVVDHVDVTTYHNYQPFEKAFYMEIDKARELAKGQAVLITETVPNSHGQDPEMSFRVFREKNIGWYFWSLVIGQCGLTYESMYTTDGVAPWPDYLAAALGFKVPSGQLLDRFDRFDMQRIAEEAKTVPTTKDNKDERIEFVGTAGLSVAWAGVDDPRLYKVIEYKEQFDRANATGDESPETLEYLQKAVLALGGILEDHGFFAAIEKE